MCYYNNKSASITILVLVYQYMCWYSNTCAVRIKHLLLQQCKCHYNNTCAIIPISVSASISAHRYTYAPPRCRTSQYRWTFIPLSVSLWNALVDPLFDGVGLTGFKTRSNAFRLAQLLSACLSSTIFPFSSFPLQVGSVGLGSSD